MTARITAISDSGMHRASYFITFRDIKKPRQEICCLLDGQHKLLAEARNNSHGGNLFIKTEKIR